MKRWWFAGACIAACACASCGDGKKEPIIQVLDPEEIVTYEASLECEAYEMKCNGVCTDIKTSESDCGGCGKKCDADQVCVQGICEGCLKTMCSGECVDVTSDVKHCGGCGRGCAANMVCQSSRCNCENGWRDCDGDASNGCETKGICVCAIGESKAYYSGPEGTKGVGECKEGRHVCQAVGGELRYVTETADVTPQYTGLCTEIDYNCNGIPDGQEDNDHDGYTPCEGDCCDDKHSCDADNPEYLNPGMIEVQGNNQDDNCNGIVDEALSTLENSEPVSFHYYDPSLTNEQQARALAQAMGIHWECKPGTVCHFGLIDAKITRSGSNVPPELHQFNVLSGMRMREKDDSVLLVRPQEGKTFAMLSTGYALDVESGAPRESMCIEAGCPNGGDMDGAPMYSRVPEDYLEANSNMLATHSMCPAASETPVIYDSVHLHLKLRTPMNAKGIAFDFRFFTQEYPKFLCGRYNDFFIAQLKTGHPGMAAYPDRNIAFDKNGNPVSVNNGFFTTCEYRLCSMDADCPNHMRCREGDPIVRGTCEGENSTCPNHMTCNDDMLCAATKKCVSVVECPSLCGNGEIEPGEACDGTEFPAEKDSCEKVVGSESTGTLGCSDDCRIILTHQCTGGDATHAENPGACGCTGSGADENCVLNSETCQDGSEDVEAFYPQPYVLQKWRWEFETPAKGEGRGGGTAWLTSTAPVLGGEDIELDFHIWDTHDGKYDSSVLLDNFRWLLDETVVNTGFASDTIVN